MVTLTKTVKGDFRIVLKYMTMDLRVISICKILSQMICVFKMVVGELLGTDENEWNLHAYF